jgi:hypothetical protein
MGKRHLLISGISLCFASSAVQADIFRCTTEEGKKVVTDRLTSECANRVVKVYANNGRLKSEIGLPPTAEEKRKVVLEQEKRKADAISEELLQKEQRYLLAHYRNEEDIEAARKRSLDVIKDRKRLASEQLQTLDQSISALQGELKGAKKSTVEFETLRQRAEDLAKTIQKNRMSVEIHDEEIVRINREFDETLLRFRTVIGKSQHK